MGILYVNDLVRQWRMLWFQFIAHADLMLNSCAQPPTATEVHLARLRSQFATVPPGPRPA